jgi:hypothetical protein
MLEVLVADVAMAAPCDRAAGVETMAEARGGSETAALKGCGDAGTPDTVSKAVSACIDVKAAVPPLSAAHRRAKSPTASRYDSRRQAARM